MSSAGRIMIAGTGSGCGKTTITCALLAAFKSEGKNIISFKCGPDYIDPMFHKKAALTDSRNLDIFLMGEEGVSHAVAHHSKGRDLALIEGVMGIYDGISSSSLASSCHVSLLTKTPVVLVVNARGKSLSVCAEIKGYLDYERNNIQGVILNGISSAMYPFYKEMIENRLPVKLLGFLPHVQGASIESRHLGLITADEIRDIQGRLKLLGETAKKHIDIPGILELAQKAEALTVNESLSNKNLSGAGTKIYVANDKAFCFYYEDNHDLLKELGAELCFFSPLNDEELPDDANGLILWGGYPELYAQALEEASHAKNSILEKINKGMPVYAECGGFIYLQKSLADLQGNTHKMLGAIKGQTKMTERLQNFGYVNLTANHDNMLCKKGSQINAHSFHYSRSDDEGSSFTAAKKSSGQIYPCIVAEKNIFAGYPHIHFLSNPDFAENFIKACVKYKESAYGKEVEHGFHNKARGNREKKL